MKFVGRTQELRELERLQRKSSASFVVIRGRRRIGKTRLIREFTKGKRAWSFAGLPPTSQTTRASQLHEFSSQMANNLGMPILQTSSWSEIFWHLGNQSKTGPIFIVLDEISWIGSKDPDFLGHLKNAWDQFFSTNPKLMLIVCGSVSSWIEENILSNTGFLGRISLDKVIQELPLTDCQEFWGKQKLNVSAYEKLKIMAITGGVPKYLEEIVPTMPAEENIQELCFNEGGLLFREYEQIFSDLFSKKAQLYGQIVKLLALRSLELGEICEKLKAEKGGHVSKYLHDLILAGFVQEDCTWNIKTQKVSQLKKFRLKDNYLRFYLRYIEPNREKIAKGLFAPGALRSLPGWETLMGLQFENLIHNNLPLVLEALNISLQDVVMAGPFFQRRTQRQKGCQVDLMIQTRSQSLYIGEIKFYRNLVPPSVIDQVEETLTRMSVPRGYSLRPFLVHVNGVSQRIFESERFTHVIDFSRMFEY